MEQEQSLKQPSISPVSSSPLLSDNMPGMFGAMAAMFPTGIPSIDSIPVEKAWCRECETISPRIHVMGFSAVICPECKRVLVDESK